MAAYLKRTASAEMRSAQYRQVGRRRRRRVLLFPLLLGLMLFLGGFMLGAARAVVEEQEEPAVEALTRSPASAVEASRWSRLRYRRRCRLRCRKRQWKKMPGSCVWSVRRIRCRRF